MSRFGTVLTSTENVQLGTEFWTLCNAIRFAQLYYDNIKDTIFRQNVTSREKKILSEGFTGTSGIYFVNIGG